MFEKGVDDLVLIAIFIVIIIFISIMRLIQAILSIFLVLQSAVLTVKAQLSDNEGSASLLASKCAASSGYPASNYREYSQDLAKVIAPLSAPQQKRVFGYIPQPIGVDAVQSTTAPAGNINVPNTATPDPGLLVGLVGSLNDALGGTTPASDVFMGTTGPTTAPVTQSSPLQIDPGLATGSAPEPIASAGSGALVADPALSGTSGNSGPPATTGTTGTTGTTSTTTTATTATTATTGSGSASLTTKPNGNSYWDQLLALVKAADAAYQSGGMAGLQEAIAGKTPAPAAP